MQVAPQPAALLLACRDDGHARAAQVGGQPHPSDRQRRADRRARRARARRAPAATARTPSRRPAGRRPRRADRARRSARRWSADRARLRVANRRRYRTSMATKSSRRSRSQAGGERRQQLVAGIGPDLLDHTAHHLERIVAGTPHEPIDGRADPPAHRLDDQREEARRRHEQPGRAALAHELSRARRRLPCTPRRSHPSAPASRSPRGPRRGSARAARAAH